MRARFRGAIVAGAVAALGGLALAGEIPVAAQTSTYKAPRTPDGKPNLNGIWQAVNTANWDIQDHPARQGPVLALGAAFSVPGGLGVVDGNVIPYQAWALNKKKENGEHWLAADPEIKCFLPGLPRATYMPYPFQIVQTPAPADMLIQYEFASAMRIVHMNGTERSPADSWMGWSRGRWDGEALVIDVTDFNDQTWFDRAGNFHSDALHVTERYAARSPEILDYEATIEDPKVFTRPWKMRMPLYRRAEKNARLTEYKCVEFVEEMMYGHLVKKSSN
jgi:hypothetical protein